ncbi:MAG TPA: monomeric sarcosine oxidase [Gammaproteobacteria bacterium]|nr:monomeric sarcosine oxidase [Gammaproteobacteria bacterium]
MVAVTQTKYLVVGAGVHGLSTAYHLALELKSKGLGSGADITVVDKTSVAAGASGIACGVIRNNYYQPAMRELMAHSVDVWESDPKAYSYHPVGYMQISPEVMHADVATIASQQKDIGYDSAFIEGADDCMRYMQGIFHDWQAQNVTSVLHEKRGGYANNRPSMMGLAAKAEAEGVTIRSGVRVTGFETQSGSGGELRRVLTNGQSIDFDYLVVAVGPWVRQFWEWLDLPMNITVVDNYGTSHDDVPMWRFLSLQEGTLGVSPEYLTMNNGMMPPVMHVDTDAPLRSDVDGSLITEEMWGIYYKPDFNFNGVQGGAAPDWIATEPKNVAIDPYGHESPDYVMGPEFARTWCSALAHCQKRFEGMLPHYREEPSGGIGCLAPDSFPVFDSYRENCYVIADSNHGYKMIGVGKLVAEEILGKESRLLQPFRFSRFAEGRLHPESNSPFPWS